MIQQGVRGWGRRVSLPLRFIFSRHRKPFTQIGLRRLSLIGTYGLCQLCANQPMTASKPGCIHEILSDCSSELLPSNGLALARRHNDDESAASIQLYRLHLTDRFFIVQVVVAMHQAAIAVSQPAHEHTFFHTPIGAV